MERMKRFPQSVRTRDRYDPSGRAFLKCNDRQYGKVVSDGNREIVVGFGVPGLQDSLKLDDLDPEFAG